MSVQGYKYRSNDVGGNFCGHDPVYPILNLMNPIPAGVGGYPAILRTLSSRLDQYYYSPRMKIPQLDLANGSDRQQRSERREACILVMKSLLKRLDLVTLKVGIPTSDGFVNLTAAIIANQAGLGLKRTLRAIRDLKAADILTVSQPRQMNSDGSWTGLAAVKAVNKSLFSIFGLTEALRYERKKAAARRKRLVRKWQADSEKRDAVNSRTGKARFGMFMGALGKAASASSEGNKRQKAARKKAERSERIEDLEYRRRLMSRLGDLKSKFPSLTRDELFEIAERELKAFRKA